MVKKVTIMVIKVDLQCPRCYKKIKKILCEFPQIQDQIYNEKNNTVTITVVCCSPEKIKQKIWCKGGKTIKCIEIKEPPTPIPPPAPKPPPTPPVEIPIVDPPKPPPAEPKPKPPPTSPVVIPIVDPPKPPPPANPIGVCCRECYEGHPGGPCFRGRPPPPCHESYGRPVCCDECSEGLPGGPCFGGHGRPPPPCYEGYGRPVYDSWGGGGRRGYYVCRCDYFCEENPSACTIM